MSIIFKEMPVAATRGGGGVANAKPKHPSDASGGYN